MYSDKTTWPKVLLANVQGKPLTLSLPWQWYRAYEYNGIQLIDYTMPVVTDGGRYAEDNE